MLKVFCFFLDLQYLLYLSLYFLLVSAMFVVMHQNTKTNSVYVKTYLAINQILILIQSPVKMN